MGIKDRFDKMVSEKISGAASEAAREFGRMGGKASGGRWWKTLTPEQQEAQKAKMLAGRKAGAARRKALKEKENANEDDSGEDR